MNLMNPGLIVKIIIAVLLLIAWLDLWYTDLEDI